MNLVPTGPTCSVLMAINRVIIVVLLKALLLCDFDPPPIISHIKALSIRPTVRPVRAVIPE